MVEHSLEVVETVFVCIKTRLLFEIDAKESREQRGLVVSTYGP